MDFIPVKMSLMDVADVTSAGIKAFIDGKARYVPGWHNRFVYLGLSKFAPHGLTSRLSQILTHRLSDFVPAVFATFFRRFRQDRPSSGAPRND